ncbi:glycosyltransferase [Nodularia spumigena]|uniref:glycosyltransferase n=1 Tax=Nodularia spumigena TaxID=70799 RepID=UPI00232C69F9|nr:glycosyltransferase [Nodularia spumigena]MDB9347870.1 glycosyltransferase [Nodularia spumigena CS-588/01]MDB9354261.1 glycosyltransferase [Nodularia spumigena CS-588/05]
MNKHILLSTQDPGVGGVAQYNHSLLCGLVKLGYRVTCLQPKPFDNKFITYEKELGIQHIWLDEGNVQTFNNIFTEANNKPDLIICSNTNPFANLDIKQIAIQLCIPYIIVEGLVEPHLAEKYPIYLNDLSHQYIQAQSVIAVSTDNLDLLHQKFRLPKYKGKVIYYGRPSEYFAIRDTSLRESLRQSLNIPSDAVVCFTSARIETRKGYQYQLEAIKQLINSPVWSQLYFVWAGAGIFEPQLEIELKEAVEQLGISNKVIFLGQRSDVADWLNAADIFVFPSLLEGMPLCVMEAMAKGLPVIASAVSGIPEELGETGKLLTDPKIDPNATVRELVTTIEGWVKQPPLRQSIGQACKQRAEKMFREERMIEETVEIIEQALLPDKDYVSPGFQIIRPDQAFPNMVVGDTQTCKWPYLRRNIPHNWYVDQRQPIIGFLSRDEAHIVYNTALKFKGKRALEIGCWLGWSACHIALAGLELDVIDPLLNRDDIYESVHNSLQSAGVIDSVNLVGGYSPQKVEELAENLKGKWSLIFIDGDHEAPGPLNDAIVCEKLAASDALILFHDLNSPDVAQGLDYLKQKGWNTMVYQTMQIMGVAWRGNVEPVKHIPDQSINWQLPVHLQHYVVSGTQTNQVNQLSFQFSESQRENDSELQKLLCVVRPYTMLSEERLFSLYSLAKQICLEDIPGNFVECGSYKGGSAALLAFVIQRYSLRPRLLYACDTFEGMPEPCEFDQHNGVAANLTGFGVGTLKAPISENIERICQILKVSHIVVPVQGLFAETLPKYKSEIGNIALLHADGDWYESTMDIFNVLYDNVVPKGIIQVDDYGHWEGCKKAIHEFESLRGKQFNLQQIDYTGVWFQKSAKIAKVLNPVILIDGVFFQLYNTGIARVWRSLLEKWANTDFAQHILVLDRANTAPKIPGIRYRTIHPYDYNNSEADKQILQEICEEEQAKLFISTYYTTPIDTPSVFMAYDMIPEVLGGNLNEPMWREKHHAIQHASAYISISEHTAKDLSKLFSDIPLESINVAHCGVADHFYPASDNEINTFKHKYGISKPYFLLGGLRGYKNSILFFQAFSQLANKQGFDIVATGAGSQLPPEWRQYTAGCTFHSLQLTDEELRLAYSGAVALVYPSKYEGFGMPIIEAMACGCPVITCPNASIPEVGGEAAIYVHDDDVMGLADALCEVQKPSLRNVLINAGLAQAKKFSWTNMAEIVSTALVDATLLYLNLRDINYIIFPDWTQPEDELGLELQQVIQTLATHPENEKIALIINAGNIATEDAEMFLSSVAMNLLMEDLDISETIDISLIAELGDMQWQSLLPRIYGRIILNNEDKTALASAPVSNLNNLTIDNLIPSS